MVEWTNVLCHQPQVLPGPRTRTSGSKRLQRRAVGWAKDRPPDLNFAHITRAIERRFLLRGEISLNQQWRTGRLNNLRHLLVIGHATIMILFGIEEIMTVLLPT